MASKQERKKTRNVRRHIQRRTAPLTDAIRDTDTCKVHVILSRDEMFGLPHRWKKKGINTRICNGEAAYIYTHPDGHVKIRCVKHRWEFKRRTEWEEHVALWMQR
jgi:hypothetical protein